MRRIFFLSLTVVALVGCGNGARTRGPNGGGVGGGPNEDGGIPGCIEPGYPGFDPGQDQDHDGYTPSQGDCDDCNPSVNPGAMEIQGNGIDDDCNGLTDEAAPTCTAMQYAKDPKSLGLSFDLCDPRFFKSATMNGPSDPRARTVVQDYGVIKPKQGDTMFVMSSGVAADENDPGYAIPQSGTDLGNTFTNPLPNVPGKMGCSQSQPASVNDYTELVLKLKAPTNANSFSFNFYFMSAEYPEFVCTMFNDEFLVLQESHNEFMTPTNIAFDMNKNPVTINNGFFTVCQNGGTPQTNNCTHPVSELNGTGYEIIQGSQPIGGGTGWLTTTAPVTPGEDITLHFIVFDEGDGILDSAAVIDNFQWLTNAVSSPTTIQ
jgi:hypothetical protein